MSRAARLLALLEALRTRSGPGSYPATAGELTAEFGLSERTLYRDLATLRAQGVAIEAGPGLGYVLRPGHILPPLMLDAEEAEALALGLRFVGRRGDDALRAAARRAAGKLAAVLPEEVERRARLSGLLVAPSGGGAVGTLGVVRDALIRERKLALRYWTPGTATASADKARDASAAKGPPEGVSARVPAEAAGSMSGEGATRIAAAAGSMVAQGTDATAPERVVWPTALGFFDGAEVLAAWCEARGAFRHFRLDRVEAVRVLDERPPRTRRALLAEWQAGQPELVAERAAQQAAERGSRRADEVASRRTVERSPERP